MKYIYALGIGTLSDITTGLCSRDGLDTANPPGVADSRVGYIDQGKDALGWWKAAIATINFSQLMGGEGASSSYPLPCIPS